MKTRTVDPDRKEPRIVPPAEPEADGPLDGLSGSSFGLLTGRGRVLFIRDAGDTSGFWF